MNYKRIAMSVLLAGTIAAAPLTAARAQSPYFANPLLWPFLAAEAILGTAALIVTVPVRIVCSDCLPPAEAYYPSYAVYAAPAYAPQPAAYAPQPAAYAPQPAYAAPAAAYRPAPYPAPANPPMSYSYAPR
jgi:hypothetical protein